MVLKRKRSDSELCSSPSSASPISILSSPSPVHAFTMDVSPHTVSFAASPAHLHSRTLKRFRDSRPSDEDVHQHTMTLLYSAAQQHEQLPPQETPLPQHPQTPSSSTNNQQSLHQFWNIHSAPSNTATAAAASPAVDDQLLTPTSCEDCGAGLAGDGGCDSMDLDGQGLAQSPCGACGKRVCFSCSVSNLGEQKRCLQCAGRKMWVGGIGWTNAGMPVC